MLRPRPAAVVLPLLAVLLAGCASSPRNDLLDVVADVTDAANDRDAADLRGALANLRAEIDSQVRDNTLSTDESTRLLTIVQQLEADAALVEPEESPSPSPSPSPSSASPTPEQTEEESPSPSPSRSPSPSPRPTEEPEEPEESEEPEAPAPTDLLPSPATTPDEPSPSASPAQAVEATSSPSPSGA